MNSFPGSSSSSSSATPSSSSGSSSLFGNIAPPPTSFTQTFLDANSVVAKIAFLLLVMFAFMMLFRVALWLLDLFLNPSNSPKLIDGMVDAKQMITIPQNPLSQGAKTIYRSQNEDKGIEFTWSIWLYVDDLTYNSGKYRCVFYKGNDYAEDPDAEVTGMNFPNNAPGMYIAPDTNRLIVVMNTFNVINEEVPINDIPMNKWFNVILRCEDTILDVYVNGTIVKRHQLHGVPKQNYGDVYVGANGGFSGYISDLWYYDYALSVSEISKIASKGPNTKGSDKVALRDKNSNYLSLRWYFYGGDDTVGNAPINT